MAQRANEQTSSRILHVTGKKHVKTMQTSKCVGIGEKLEYVTCNIRDLLTDP